MRARGSKNDRPGRRSTSKRRPEMNGHAYPDKPITKKQLHSATAFVVLAALTVVAILAVLAPTANAGTKRQPVVTGPQAGSLSIDSTTLTPACGSGLIPGGKICLQ